MNEASPRPALVVGLARSGVAAAELLLAEGVAVTVTDVKPEAALAEPAAFELGVQPQLAGDVPDVGRLVGAD